VDCEGFKEKEYKRKIKKGKWLRERSNNLNKWRKRRKDKMGGSFTKKISPHLHHFLFFCRYLAFTLYKTNFVFVGKLM